MCFRILLQEPEILINWQYAYHLIPKIPKESSCYPLLFCYLLLTAQHFLPFPHLRDSCASAVTEIFRALFQPTHLSSQEQEFVYLLPTQLKLYWNMLQKKVMELRDSHEALLLQMVALLCQEAGRLLPRKLAFLALLHISLGLASSNICLVIPLRTRFVTVKNKHTFLGFGR